MSGEIRSGKIAKKLLEKKKGSRVGRVCVDIHGGVNVLSRGDNRRSQKAE